MYFTTFIATLAAIISLAQADFMVYTVPPIPTDSIPKFTDPAQVSKAPHPSPRPLSAYTIIGIGLDSQRLHQR
jgi:hypothetical protein